MNDNSDWVPSEVFISYAHDEKEKVERIYRKLNELGLRVWFDAELRSGSKFGDDIDREVSHSRCVLVCWSQQSTKSVWVRAEAQKGLERGNLVAAIVEPVEAIPVPFNPVHAVDLTDWNGEQTHSGWQNLLGEIGRRVGRLGLPLLAVIKGSEHVGDWKSFYWKYYSDPAAHEIWEKIEKFERSRFAAAREGVRRQSLDADAALRSARELQGRSVDQAFEEWLLKTRQGAAGDPPQPALVQTPSGEQLSELRAELVIARNSLAIAQDELENLRVKATESPNGATRIGWNSPEMRLDRSLDATTGAEPENTAATEAEITASTALRRGSGFARFALAAAVVAAVGVGAFASKAYFGPRAFAEGKRIAEIDVRRAMEASAAEKAASRVGDLVGAIMTGAEASSIAEAIEVYDKAGAAGLNDLGGRYYHAEPADFETSRVVWQFAAALGDADALTNLGLMYQDGRGASADIGIAQGYFAHAASLGNARAAWALGLLYASHPGVIKDASRALVLFKYAGQNDEPRGHLEAARLLIRGQDIPRDLDEAERLLLKIDEHTELGQKDAKALLDAITNLRKNSPPSTPRTEKGKTSRR